jgi:hypothetical protein
LAAPETYAHVSELFAGMKSLSIKRPANVTVVLPQATEGTKKMSFAHTVGNAQSYAVFNQATNQSRTTTMAHQLPSGEQRVTTSTAAVSTHVTVYEQRFVQIETRQAKMEGKLENLENICYDTRSDIKELLASFKLNSGNNSNQGVGCGHDDKENDRSTKVTKRQKQNVTIASDNGDIMMADLENP